MEQGQGLFLPDVFFDQFESLTVAAGSQLDYTFLDGVRARLLSLVVTLDTSAVVGDRRLRLIVRNTNDAAGFSERFVLRSGFVQPADTIYRYFFVPGQVEDAALVDADYVLCRMPFPIEVRGTGNPATGWSIISDIANLDAADEITSVSMYARASGGLS